MVAPTPAEVTATAILAVLATTATVATPTPRFVPGGIDVAADADGDRGR